MYASVTDIKNTVDQAKVLTRVLINSSFIYFNVYFFQVGDKKSVSKL